MSGEGTVTLLGSGEPRILHAMAHAAMARVGKAAPSVVVSCAAMDLDAARAAHLLTAAASMFPGAEIARFSIRGERGAMPTDEARRMVERADIVFLGGGDPARGARLLRAAGADAWLREARARGGELLGVSAGSIMLGAFWAAWDNDDEEGEPVPCAAVVADLVVDCHDEESAWEELRLVRDILAKKGVSGLRFAGIPAGGAVVAHPGGKLTHEGAPPTFLG